MRGPFNSKANISTQGRIPRDHQPHQVRDGLWGCRLFSRSFNKTLSESRKWEGHLRSFHGYSRARAWLLLSYFWDGTCHINQALKRLAQLNLTLVYLELWPRITACWEPVYVLPKINKLLRRFWTAVLLSAQSGELPQIASLAGAEMNLFLLVSIDNKYSWKRGMSQDLARSEASQ